MSEKIQQWIYDIETHPIVVALVFFIGVLFLYNVYKKGSTTTPTTTSTGVGDPSVQDVYNQTFNSYPVVPPPAVPPVITPPRQPGPPVVVPPVLHRFLVIRQPSTQDRQRGKKTVPIRKETKRYSTDTGSISFGATIATTGVEVAGEYNYPLSGGQGSNMWYPVSNGFISAYDVEKVVTQ